MTAQPAGLPEVPPEPDRPPRARLLPGSAGRPARILEATGPARPHLPTADERARARRREALAAPEPVVNPPVPTTDPGVVACTIVLAAVEALAGARPAAQLARWVAPEILEPLARRAALVARTRVRSTGRVELRRFRVCRIGPRVAEVCVVVADNGRVRAAAIRLEPWRGAWRAVALEIG